MIRQAVVLAVGIGAMAAVSAQSPADQPRFEVASVKPNISDEEPSMSMPPHGSVVIKNVPLENVIVNAYGVPAFQIVDAPDWIQRERFDITAKPPDDAAAGQAQLMLHTLLADRFKLQTHWVTREQSIYTLDLARDDARLGPDLMRTTSNCATAEATLSVPASPGSPCSGFLGVGPAGGTIVLNGQPISKLISALSMAVKRPIVDRTGLEGLFDVRLRWSADVNVNAGPSEIPSIFTALQEQLGLKLEPSRGPVEVLVIDSVERPTPD